MYQNSGPGSTFLSMLPGFLVDVERRIADAADEAAQLHRILIIELAVK